MPQPSLASSTSSIKKQRSLTPDKDIDTETGLHISLKKQRSLTPEERRKIVSKHTPPPTVRQQYEMAKNNAERKRFEEKLSRSSSSSSYSGDENRPRRGHVSQSGRQYPGSNKVSSNNVTSSNNSLDSGDHRIRRSR